MNTSKLSPPITSCATGLLVAFFMPWAQLLGHGLSGYDFGRIGSYGNWAWAVPICAGATILTGLSGATQRPLGILTGAVPFIGLIFLLSKVGENLFQLLSIGAYLTLLLSVAIIVFSFVPKGNTLPASTASG